MHTPPYRLATERVLLRCWDPADAPRLKDAVDSSLEHLRAWLPWAWDDPAPLADKVAMLRQWRAAFDRDEDHSFAVFDATGATLLGAAGLHHRVGPRALEIGYWTRVDAVRRGVASAAAAVLTHVALTRCGADRVEIHVEVGNDASAAIPAALGYTREATLPQRLPDRDGELRDADIYTLYAGQVDRLRRLPAYRAWDASGEPVPGFPG